jgi:hypothetical protein
MQQLGHWQPRHLSKQARKALQQANSVYNLPSTKQAIKWMQAVCGYLGVVHAYMDQKLLKSNKIKSFNRCPKHRI